MKTLPILNLWNDWLHASDQVIALLHEQTVALTLRDVARIEKIQPTLDQLLIQVQTIDTQAVACMTQLAETLGCEPKLRSIVCVLEKTEGQRLQETSNKVVISAQKLQHLLQKNRELIENEVRYVNGTLTLIAKAAQTKAEPFAKAAVRTAILVDQAA